MENCEYIVKIPETQKEIKIIGITKLTTYMEIMFDNGYEYIEVKSKGNK